LLKRALVDLEDLHAEHLAPVGVSGRELGVLLLLDREGPESQQQTAGRLKVDRTTMVALLDGLEAKGSSRAAQTLATGVATSTS
jgi:DNA-binding MarR family transcriptional regulator